MRRYRFLFGRKQDMLFELPIGTARMCHHMRLWHTGQAIAGKTI